MRLPLITIILLLALPSCLDFDGQDIHIRIDTDKDKIEAIVIYRGLFANKHPDAPLKDYDGRDPVNRAINQLKHAQEKGLMAFWRNWPLAIDLTENYEANKDVTSHIDLEYGGLFTDPTGTLCGYQLVRINNATAFIQKLNLIWQAEFLNYNHPITSAIKTGTSKRTKAKRFGKRESRPLDQQTHEAFKAMLESGEHLLSITNGRIEMRLPLSDGDHRIMKRSIEHELLSKLEETITNAGTSDDETKPATPKKFTALETRQEVAQAPFFRFIWDNPISMQRTKNLTTIGIGVTNADELHIKKASEGAYDNELQRRLTYNRTAIEMGLPDEELQRRFTAFRAREAKLPFMLRKLRK
jgi:hypothetical protein